MSRAPDDTGSSGRVELPDDVPAPRAWSPSGLPLCDECGNRVEPGDVEEYAGALLCPGCVEYYTEHHHVVNK